MTGAVDSVTAPPSPAGTLGPGTLARQLVLRVVALVAVLALALSGLTILATREVLKRQLDGQLDDVTGRFDVDRSGGPRRGLLVPGQPIGTVAAAYDQRGAVIGSGILQEKGGIPSPGEGPGPELPAATLADLADVAPDAGKTTRDIAGLGRYRLVAFDAVIVTGLDRIQGRIVVGLPMAPVDNALRLLGGVSAILSAIAVGCSVLAARTLVLRSLRPLHRVAGVAQQVSALPLARGEVAVGVRVPAADTDPRNEVGRVGRAMNTMIDHVESALTARQASETKVRQFVADASHELRNPLASIRGYAELTRRDRAELPAPTGNALNRIEAESVRMSGLVEDLLLLARLDAGPNLTLQPVDVGEIVLNAVSDARVAGPEHHWRLDLPDRPIMVTGDRGRLHQVVVNLLANARTHTPPGTTVRASLRVDAGSAIVTVADDGPGVPPEIVSTVFERFTRADTARARAGSGSDSTGLGLAIVAAVVDAHGGTVRVMSRPGDTRFEVLLPLA